MGRLYGSSRWRTAGDFLPNVQRILPACEVLTVAQSRETRQLCHMQHVTRVALKHLHLLLLGQRRIYK